eukprot:GHVP01011609.1.p1 GENE.GHVP01011609.1~~GHVP01011609.1.p1  ORF type:complete len:438 (-),score=103.01 GHVP01011609.1:215-1528(-)
MKSQENTNFTALSKISQFMLQKYTADLSPVLNSITKKYGRKKKDIDDIKGCFLTASTTSREMLSDFIRLIKEIEEQKEDEKDKEIEESPGEEEIEVSKFSDVFETLFNCAEDLGKKSKEVCENIYSQTFTERMKVDDTIHIPEKRIVECLKSIDFAKKISKSFPRIPIKPPKPSIPAMEATVVETQAQGSPRRYAQETQRQETQLQIYNENEVENQENEAENDPEVLPELDTQEALLLVHKDLNEQGKLVDLGLSNSYSRSYYESNNLHKLFSQVKSITNVMDHPSIEYSRVTFSPNGSNSPPTPKRNPRPKRQRFSGISEGSSIDFSPRSPGRKAIRPAGSGRPGAWSEEELIFLIKGINEFGRKWTDIEKSGEIKRSQMQIKDKWRNLVKFKRIGRRAASGLFYLRENTDRDEEMWNETKEKMENRRARIRELEG